MYTIEAFKRKIDKEGVPAVLQLLSSPSLPAHTKAALSENKILVNGEPNYQLISSLVA